MAQKTLVILSFAIGLGISSASWSETPDNPSQAEGRDLSCEVPEACTADMTSRKLSLPPLNQNDACIGQFEAGGVTTYKTGCVTNSTVIPKPGTSRPTTK